MRKLLTLLLALLLAPTAAFARDGASSRDLSWISQAAMVNGQVYGMTSKGGWQARTTVYAQTEKGMEAVWTGVCRARGIFAWGDKLLMVAEKPKDFWEELLEMYETPGERFVQVLDPATWEAEALPIPPEESLVFTMDGEMVRFVCWQTEDVRRAEILRWNGAAWEEAFAWTGDALPEDWYGSELYPGFIRLGQRVHDGGLRDIRIVTLADGREYLLTDVERRYGNAMDAVLEDGVLYLMGDSGLWAFDLAAGTRELLLPGTAGSFLMSDKYVVFSYDADYTDNECRMPVYDRRTWTLLREIVVDNDSSEWLLDGDTLYLQDYTKGGYTSGGVTKIIRPTATVIDLTSGERITTAFEY